MAKKQTKYILTPQYFKNFQCIGGSCEDNCCIGWDVEIDKASYEKYEKIKDPELSGLIRKCIYINDYSYDFNIDYAIVELAKNNRCPFLNEKNLCKIQAKLGHDYLSNVCATYPRYANEVNGVEEYSANISCPEAAKLILMNKDGLKFTKEIPTSEQRKIINCAINTNESKGNIMLTYFVELRDFTISTLQNRDYSLWERILILGHFYDELQHLLDTKKKFDVLKLIESYNQKTKNGDWKKEFTSITPNLSVGLNIMLEITDNINNKTKIDSKRYIDFMNEVSEGLAISKNNSLKSKEKSYENACKDYYLPFMKNHEYIIENYLVNFVFGGLFPVAESTKPFDSYMLLVIRYMLITYNLIGISGFRKGLAEDICIKFIQVFSKAIEHHHTYLEGIAKYMSKKKYYSLKHVEILLKK